MLGLNNGSSFAVVKRPNPIYLMELLAQTLNRFATQHKNIKLYIDDLPPEAIYMRLQADKWSIHETIAYLNRYQYVFMGRLLSMLEEVNPFFEMYRPEEDTEYRYTAAKTTGSLLHELYRLREDILQLLQQLPENSCARVATHEKLGKMTVAQWVEFFLLHESNQLYKIFKMAGNFWSTENISYGNVISLPAMNNNQIDE